MKILLEVNGHALNKVNDGWVKGTSSNIVVGFGDANRRLLKSEKHVGIHVPDESINLHLTKLENGLLRVEIRYGGIVPRQDLDVDEFDEVVTLREYFTESIRAQKAYFEDLSKVLGEARSKWPYRDWFAFGKELLSEQETLLESLRP